MRRNIPSLGALQSFVSAAKHLSFTRAAEDLHVTQSAVSRHVRALEDQLGIRLFHRSQQRVTLTRAGEQYLPDIAASLDRIEASTLRLRPQRRRDSAVNLAVPPTFAANWLVPRLLDFAEVYPEIRLNLSIRLEPDDFASSNLNAAIVFRDATSSDVASVKLMGEDLLAVCSPEMLQGRGLFTSSELADHKLLELGIPGSWSGWFHAAERPDLARAPDIRYEYFLVGIQAAISGAGVLLAPRCLIADDIREGRLAVAASETVRSGWSYYLIYPTDNKSLPAINAFRDWILKAAAESRRQYALL